MGGLQQHLLLTELRLLVWRRHGLLLRRPLIAAWGRMGRRRQLWRWPRATHASLMIALLATSTILLQWHRHSCVSRHHAHVTDLVADM